MEQISQTSKKYVAEYTLQDLLPVALVFVVTSIAIAFGANVLTSVGAGFTANSAAANTTTNGQVALGNISSQLGLLATVVVAAIIIGVIVRSFGGAAN